MAQWTVTFDPTHHRTLGEHNHTVILRSNAADEPALEIATLADVIA